MRKVSMWFGVVFAFMAFSAWAYTPVPPLKTEAKTPQFTFAWPLDEGAPKPRGGTTKGADVTLQTAPSKEWQALQETGLDTLERDRRAILAMAGEFRVSFDFLEIATFDAQHPRDRPYQSWGTELVLVAEDRGDFIALQHLLVMRMQGDDADAKPMVMRHWRQEWQWQGDKTLSYAGGTRWQSVPVGEAEKRGAWVQTVYQVDDSPRYASHGRWEHNAAFSTWISAETWRPLPRREYSSRDDYQVLRGTNRHTVLPTSWMQEENNLKLVLNAKGEPDAALPYRSREYGVARYERITGFDFSAGREYFERTEPFWAQVRTAWAARVAANGGYTLQKHVDQGGLFAPFFDYAQKLADGEATFDAKDAAAFVSRTLEESYFVK
ncbi:MAG: DUF6607 family protein [Lysobacteraceae bacterium]